MNLQQGANSANIVVTVFRRHIDIGGPMTFPRVRDWPSANRSLQIKLDSCQYFSFLIVQDMQSHMEYLPLATIKYG